MTSGQGWRKELTAESSIKPCEGVGLPAVVEELSVHETGKQFQRLEGAVSRAKGLKLGAGSRPGDGRWGEGGIQEKGPLHICVWLCITVEATRPGSG